MKHAGMRQRRAAGLGAAPRGAAVCDAPLYGRSARCPMPVAQCGSRTSNLNVRSRATSVKPVASSTLYTESNCSHTSSR